MNSTKTQAHGWGLSYSEVENLTRQAHLLRAEFIAEAFSAFVGAIKKGFVLFNDWVVEPIAKAQKKSHLYNELSNLDDQILRDMGISRSEIPYVVMNAFEESTTEASKTDSVTSFQALAAAPIKSSSNDDDQAIAA
jgi:hypothetical protein